MFRKKAPDLDKIGNSITNKTPTHRRRQIGVAFVAHCLRFGVGERVPIANRRASVPDTDNVVGVRVDFKHGAQRAPGHDEAKRV